MGCGTSIELQINLNCVLKEEKDETLINMGHAQKGIPYPVQVLNENGSFVSTLEQRKKKLVIS